MSTITTIKVSKESKQRWENYKTYPKESMEDLINRAFMLAYETEDPLNDKDLEDISKSLDDFRNNRYKTTDQLLKELEA